MTLLLLSNAATAQHLDAYMQSVMHEHQIVGLSVAVVRDGKVVEAKGYGLANLETGTPATAKTVYKIASISKQFIASAILLLVQNAPSWITVRASGAFLSTVLDMAKWDAVLDTDRVLPSSLRQRMWTPARLNDGTTHPYGFGWAVETMNGHKRVHHNGGTPGFASDFERFPDDKLAVIVLINTASINPEEVALHIAGLYNTALAR